MVTKVDITLEDGSVQTFTAPAPVATPIEVDVKLSDGSENVFVPAV